VPRERFAPAKVNLFLHVASLGADGYHPLSSLMVFADVGDTIRLEPAAGPAFVLEGPFAETLGQDDDNLVVRARDLMLHGGATPDPPFRLTLIKRLPIAAGLGGGSADAAATLALIAAHLGPEHPAAGPRALGVLARSLGADVAACLESVPVIATGRGDVLEPAPPMPPLDAVLVNPRAPSPTGQVYRAYDESGAPGGADNPSLPGRFEDAGQLIDFLDGTRNDLQAPACALRPEIAEALGLLAAAPGARLARMSGSGATCFALCANRDDAQRVAACLAGARPHWWTVVCRLGAGEPG